MQGAFCRAKVTAEISYLCRFLLLILLFSHNLFPEISPFCSLIRLTAFPLIAPDLCSFLVLLVLLVLFFSVRIPRAFLEQHSSIPRMFGAYLRCMLVKTSITNSREVVPNRMNPKQTTERNFEKSRKIKGFRS